jgi:hypothetical protein
MTPYIILAAVLGLPPILGLIFRVSTSHLFFSLMAGELLGRYFGHEAELIIASVFRQPEVAQYAELAVVLLPVFVTAVLLRGTLTKSRAVLHIIPLAVTGVVLGAFALPILPETIQEIVQTVPIGKALLDVSNLVVGLVVLLQLVALWLLNGAHNHKEKHKR